VEPAILNVQGIQIVLKTVRRNQVYNCNCNIYSDGICNLKIALSLVPSKSILTATEVMFNIRNATSSGWSIQKGPWELVDTDGYAYRPSELCDRLHPPRTMSSSWTLSPGTQVNFVLVFPELEEGKEVARILYSVNRTFFAFELRELKPEAMELLHSHNGEAAGAVDSDWELRSIKATIDGLELLIYSRLNNVLTPQQRTKLENEIRQKTFQIEQQLKNLNATRRSVVEGRFREILASYDSQLEAVRAREDEHKHLDQKVSQLYEMSPREFEEYVAELFRLLGYERVTLTPTSNDQGIDILAEHRGTAIAIQCKKYKGKVGSPAMQTFLGAMRNAGVQKGLFVTTGVFSLEAERMANEHPIELIDGLALGKLIQEALKRA